MFKRKVKNQNINITIGLGMGDNAATTLMTAAGSMIICTGISSMQKIICSALDCHKNKCGCTNGKLKSRTASHAAASQDDTENTTD